MPYKKKENDKNDKIYTGIVLFIICKIKCITVKFFGGKNNFS